MSRKQHRGHDDVTDRAGQHYLADHGGLWFNFDQYAFAVCSSAADRFHGGSMRDYFWGRGGDDELVGAGGDDVLYGGDGMDLLVGGSEADMLDGGMGKDELYGGQQADTLKGGEGDDFLDEGIGHGDLVGGPGRDTLVGGMGPDAFGVSRTSGDDVIKDFSAGPGMSDHLALMDLRWEDLTITQQTAGTLVSWDGGSALLEGVNSTDLAQDDFMFGAAPDLPPGARPPSAPAAERPTPSTDGPSIGGSTLSAEQQSFDAKAEHALERGGLALAFDEVKVSVGATRSDHVHGGSTMDTMPGRAGQDKLWSSASDDVLNGDTGSDRLLGGEGDDQLDGGMGNDRLASGDGNDMLMGGDGADMMNAGAGHDMLDSGAGNDIMRGGPGADAFIVSLMSGDDVVLDFEAIGEALGAFDHVAFDDIDAGDLVIADTGQGALISWDVNHNGRSEGSILLQGIEVSDLRQSDFMFETPQFVPGIDTYGSYYVFPA